MTELLQPQIQEEMIEEPVPNLESSQFVETGADTAGQAVMFVVPNDFREDQPQLQPLPAEQLELPAEFESSQSALANLPPLEAFPIPELFENPPLPEIHDVNNPMIEEVRILAESMGLAPQELNGSLAQIIKNMMQEYDAASRETGESIVLDISNPREFMQGLITHFGAKSPFELRNKIIQMYRAMLQQSN